jgi:hypothetical protein
MSLTDKEFALVRRRINVLTERWGAEIGMNWWKLQIAYERDGAAMGRDENWVCTMTAAAKWQYRDAKITVNCEMAHEADDETLEEWFVHELAHVLVNEMRAITSEEKVRDGWIDHEEHVCVGIQRALVWARRAGFKEGRSRRPLFPLVKS